MIRVLYDGWSLVHQPNSPAALHLLTLLLQRHPEVEANVALPEASPDWLPGEAIAHLLPTPDTLRGRIAWEQRSLPRLAVSLGVDLLHLTTANPPLFSRAVAVVSPAEFPSFESPGGFASRLRLALASGGMSRLNGLFLPEDYPGESAPGRETLVFRLPTEPFPAEDIIAARQNPQLKALHLPETYILYHGPYGKNGLYRLLEAWSWAAGPIGRDYPLLLVGMTANAQNDLRALLAGTDWEDNLRPLPSIRPDLIPLLYQNCAAVFHPAPLAPWGGCARLALAYGKPLVAAENPASDALAGGGAYLAPQDNPRALGAALITVIVEEQLGQELAQAGRQRAAGWNPQAFKNALYSAYQAVLKTKPG